MDIQTYLIDTPSEFMKDSLNAWRSLEIIGDVWRLLPRTIITYVVMSRTVFISGSRKKARSVL